MPGSGGADRADGVRAAGLLLGAGSVAFVAGMFLHPFAESESTGDQMVAAATSRWAWDHYMIAAALAAVAVAALALLLTAA